MGPVLSVRPALVLVPLTMCLAACTVIAGYDDREPRPDDAMAQDDAPPSPFDTSLVTQDAAPGDDVATPAEASDTHTDPPADTGSDESLDAPRIDAGDASDAVATCPATSTTCADRCTDLTADPLHCGACGTPCADLQYCDGSGKCACRPGLSLCGGVCVDVASDPDNCGGCGRPCGDSSVCSAGVCKKSCAGATRCSVTGGGACVDLLGRDPQNCGACGKRCSASEVCVAGTCRAYAPGVGCSTCPCDACSGLLGGARCCAPLLGQRSPLCVAGGACP